MQKVLRLFLLLVAASSPALAQRNIGEVTVQAENKTIPVRVSANTPELNDLAVRAFGVHGRYRRTASDFAYDIKFSLVTPTEVRVDITKGRAAAPFSSDVATGRDAADALLRAADIAVEKTNGMGLKGFFTAKIAFVGESSGRNEIYTGDLFFRHVTQVTHDKAFALTPRWSPDGTKLLYTSFYRSGFPDIFLIDLNTYQRTTFVSFKGTNSGARFSPSGGQVAMVLSGEGTPEIYLANAQGRQVSRKTRSDAVKASPCFSPDGSRLVFSMEPGPQLYVMSVAGGTPTRVTSGISGYCAEPDWSRGDPNKIAFTVKQGSRFQIAVLDLAKRTSEIVGKAAFDGVEPAWLADGRHVVYTARDRSTNVLCILDTETGKSTPISPKSFGSAMKASVWAR
ncbi:MAG: Periplasmic component of the Tol biopolymer transport system-like protein [Verrucomicrobia bacterium]|nr:Periplasmic component of the Tol biopolymer transport system-like protein [Verrucomicrobiota bacterium]